MNITNKKLNYNGQDTLPAIEFNPRDIKLKICIMLDGDLLKVCKEEAAKSGMGYQTLINQRLREVFLSPESLKLEKRVSLLEKIFLQKTPRFIKDKSKKKKAS